MAIMTRLLRLWKADMHGVMDQLEDKALLLKQCLREMESSLRQKQARLEQLRRNLEQLANDQALRLQEQEKLEADIALAVRKEKDEIARMLIRKRMLLEDTHARLESQRRHLEEETQRLVQTIAGQQGQYDQLKVKAAAYCQQAEQRAEDPASLWNEQAGPAPVTAEEVEMELMRRKETLTQGGAA
ncbi:MAG: PspA/IM30 family protein [Desulfatitalea sp.]|nr:PspA/IM30 family protein [Desulfatitalea sp.]